MQLSDGAIVSIVTGALVHTGALIWSLASIKAEIKHLREEFTSYREDDTARIRKLGARVRHMEIHCAQIHGALGEPEGDNGNDL